MDLYLTSAEPGLTLQEMIDCDIKGGMDFEPGFPAGETLPFDFGAMTGLDSDELDIKAFEPLFDPLEEEEVHEMGNPRVPTGGESSPMASWMNLSAMTNFNLDIETSVMVNPSDVLPSPHYTQSKRHRVTPPPIISIKKEPQFQELQRLHNRINSHPSSPVTTQVVLQPITTTTTTTTPQSPMDSTPTSGITQNLVITNSPSASHRHITTTSTPVHTTLQLNTNGVSSITPTATSAISVYQPSLRQTSSLPFTPNRTKPLPKYPRRERTPEEKSYPKPAYSYACLIALALKNSITGSLPVSEIYSFMCEHFPYFRTAPNGWKNSVRHNLSLNKCFEKIEKPVVSGSNQRKGCLWALNPMKAHKMDEEVQKWSKKDLQGIRDAMTCPEVLESLEKGEMKFEATSGASSCSEDEEEEEGPSEPVFLTEHHQQTIAPIKVISSTPVGITQSINVHSHQNGFRSSPNSISQRESNNSTAISSSHGHPQQIVRTLSSSPEPEYILPDSTMPEINIQSNGSLIDDFGNEITLDGDLSILNPRGGSVQSSGANLILRKVNASPLRNSSIRSNFVYTTSSSANLIPHQNGMNRLVLTNTKLSS